MDTNVPMLRGVALKERMTIPMEAELKKELQILKNESGVDVLEWIRGLIRRDLPKLKSQIGKQGEVA